MRYVWIISFVIYNVYHEGPTAHHHSRDDTNRGAGLRRWYANRLVLHSSTLTCLRLGLLGGKVIGLPPVLNFGSSEIKAKVTPVFPTHFRIYPSCS